MANKQKHVVTGAFGYSGKYIASMLLKKGHNVKTLTNSFNKENPFGNRVEAYPYHFDAPDKLAESLRGTSVLYNTYWVRFNHRLFSHSKAIANTLILFEAAKQAGVKRVVHISITNPLVGSGLEYFEGKAFLEKALKASGLSYAILRPTVLFGKEDILINNIAWMLRKFPFFGVFGDGNYGIQPIYVNDLAKIAVEQGEKTENTLINTVGPEQFSYRELVKTIGETINRKRPIVSIPPKVGYWISYLLGIFTGDIIVTREEIKGLMEGTLIVDTVPTGDTKLTSWAKKHAASLGQSYTSELARRKGR